MPHQFDTTTCPKCGGKAAKVVDSRPHTVAGVLMTRRRKACPCGHRHYTVEVHQDLFDAADLGELIQELSGGE